MAFAMKGGGSRGGLECHIPILKNDFFKTHLESFPDCENVGKKPDPNQLVTAILGLGGETYK